MTAIAEGTELRTGKGSVYSKTLELTEAGERLLETAETMSRLADELSAFLLQTASYYQAVEDRTKALPTVIIDWFMVRELQLCDAYAILRDVAKQLLTYSAARPGPFYTESMKRVYGAEYVPLSLGHGKGRMSDPLANWIAQLGESVTGKLESEADIPPYSEALFKLFKSRNLTVREALAVIATTESDLLNAPIFQQPTEHETT